MIFELPKLNTFNAVVENAKKENITKILYLAKARPKGLPAAIQIHKNRSIIVQLEDRIITPNDVYDDAKTIGTIVARNLNVLSMFRGNIVFGILPSNMKKCFLYGMSKQLKSTTGRLQSELNNSTGVDINYNPANFGDYTTGILQYSYVYRDYHPASFLVDLSSEDRIKECYDDLNKFHAKITATKSLVISNMLGHNIKNDIIEFYPSNYDSSKFKSLAFAM